MRRPPSAGRLRSADYKHVLDLQTGAERDQPSYAQTRALHARIFEFKYNEAANQVVQENRESFSQERIDAFIRTHPPLLEHDASVMSEYAEMCRSRFFGSRLRSLQSTLQYADTAISRLKRIEP